MQRPSDRDVIDLLSSLVAIDSVNPSLVPGAAGEEQIAHFVAGWLTEAGLVVELPEILPGRPNVVGRLRGGSSGKTLMLNAHLDTVGVAGMDQPHLPRVENDRLYGRGSYDMKAGLAAIMLAARSVQRSGELRGELVIAGVMDEEYASLGTSAVLRRSRADGAIVTEPTGLRLCIAHKGFAWIRITTVGRAAHGSKPELGVDAIAHMGRILTALEALGNEMTARPAHRWVGTGSLHASLIEGGQELSSYPETCVMQVERRTVPGETAEAVLGEVQDIIETLQARDPQFRAETELLLWRDPFEVDDRAPLVETVLRAAQISGVAVPGLYGDTPWMDAALLSAAGIETVVFGPGGEGAHAAVEWASISQVADCALILARAAIDFCGRQTPTD